MKLHKLEEKDNVMENLYAMFHIREAVGRLQMFFKIRVLKNLANFTKKILLQSLLDKVAGLKRSETLLKRDSSTSVLAKFLRTPFSTEHLWCLLLKPKNVFNFHGFLL